MMRFIAILGFTAVAFSQVPSVVNTGPRILQPPGASNGNILFPGGTSSNNSHATNLGNSVSGVNSGPRTGNRGGNGGPIGRPRTIVVPYGFPVYQDPGYYQQQQQQAPNVTVVVPPPTTPTVIINQSYVPETANPSMRIYGDDEQPIDANASVQIYRAPVAPRAEGRPIAQASSGSRVIDEKATIYLIALRDNSVHSAIGYWANKGDLMFVSPAGKISRVPLDQLDRKTTEQLNAERKVDIDLTTLQ